MKYWQYLIPVIALILMSLPTMYPQPVLQTDGIAYYGFAKTWSETGSFEADVPEYYRFASVQESKVGHYTPFVTVTLGILLKMGGDVLWLNGIYCGLLFAMAAWFIYLLSNYLKINPLLVLPLALLNIRPYFTAWVGSLTAFAGFAFSIPAVYYAIKFFDSNDWQDGFWALAFLLLTGLSYIQFVLYTLTLFVILFIARLMKNMEITWPKVRAKTFKIKWKSGWLVVVGAAITAVIIKVFMFAASGRKGYITDYVNYLMQNGVGYPRIWELPVLTDNAIVVALAIGGLAYAIYKQRWYLVALAAGTLGCLLSGPLLGLSNAWIFTYVLRFYTLNAVFLALLAGYLIQRLWKYKLTKIVFGVAVAAQLVMFIAFASMVQPAITAEEMHVSNLLQSTNKPITFVENVDFGNNFAEPAWIMAFAQPQAFEVVFEVPDYLPAGLVLVEDKTVLTKDELKLLSFRKVVYEGEKVLLVE
ncbi:MAG: hypothetical protein QF486_02095 [Candidatus Woesearchaeota archaeon]|jgi:hypothetical protein|nr:hypothetical protein [Candidatus Woesearchaeota archaeon]MDP7180994.1 hypothetical protein [Candidatus Woesearchaeota archaeon]MDP7198385.1 hypothetical protein [Candidatus Woesearchaeota archaeon]MDP7467487.1 hypothetical protein [Candidatus Woesearchaeota archaeon]MDP7647714.1 hypothetical protein [Candidatus Woesearchaeota archaeon]